MPKKLKVILNWDGPYEDPNAVPKRAGHIHGYRRF